MDLPPGFVVAWILPRPERHVTWANQHRPISERWIFSMGMTSPAKPSRSPDLEIDPTIVS